MEWMTRINWVDALVIIIVLRSTYVGSQRGFFGELFNIIGICFSIIFGIHFYFRLSNFLNAYLLIPLNIANFISFIIIALIVFIVIKYIYGLLTRIIKIEMFQAISKTGGTLLGFLRGTAICMLLVFVMLLVPISYITESVKSRSLLSPFLAGAGSVMYKKSIGLISAIEDGKLERILSGAEPINFEGLRLKKRDKLDEILQ